MAGSIQNFGNIEIPVLIIVDSQGLNAHLSEEVIAKVKE